MVDLGDIYRQQAKRYRKKSKGKSAFGVSVGSKDPIAPSIPSKSPVDAISAPKKDLPANGFLTYLLENSKNQNIETVREDPTGFYSLGGVQHKIPTEPDIIDKAWDSAPVKFTRDVTKDGLLKALDIVSRPVYAVNSAYDEVYSKNDEAKKGNTKFKKESIMDGITAITNPITAGQYAVGKLHGQNALDSLDDMGPSDYLDVVKAGVKGLKGERKTLGSDIIKHNADRNPDKNLYDNSYYQIGAGLASDVVLDPTSYIGVGLVKSVSTSPLRAGKNIITPIKDAKVKSLAEDLANTKALKNEEDIPFTSDEILNMLGGKSVRYTSASHKAQEVARVRSNINSMTESLKKDISLPSNKKLAQIEAATKRLQEQRRLVEKEFEGQTFKGALRREIEINVLRGKLPDSAMEELDHVFTTSHLASALPKIRNFNQKKAALDKAILHRDSLLNSTDKIPEASIKSAEKAVKIAEGDMVDLQSADELLGPGWTTDPRITPEKRNELLSMGRDMAKKNDPFYAKYEARSVQIYKQISKLEKDISDANKAGDFAKAKSLQNSLDANKKAQYKVNRRKDRIEASYILRGYKHHLKYDGEKTYKQNKEVEALLSKREELHKELENSTNTAYTGMTREEYNASGTHTPLGPEDDVPFDKHSDINYQLKAIDKELKSYETTLTPAEVGSLNVPSSVGEFDLKWEDGKLNEHASQFIEYKSFEKGFESKVTGDPEVDRWSRDLVQVLNDNIESHYSTNLDSALRVGRAKNQSLREEKLMDSATQKMFGEGTRNKVPAVMVDGEKLLFGATQKGQSDLSSKIVTKRDKATVTLLHKFVDEIDNTKTITGTEKIRTLYTVLKNNGHNLPKSKSAVISYIKENRQAVKDLITADRLAFMREFKKQHGISISDAIVKRDRALGHVVKGINSVDGKLTWWGSRHSEGLTRTEFISKTIGSKEDFADAFIRSPFSYHVHGVDGVEGSHAQFVSKSKLSPTEASKLWVDAAFKQVQESSIKELSDSMSKVYDSALSKTVGRNKVSQVLNAAATRKSLPSSERVALRNEAIKEAVSKVNYKIKHNELKTATYNERIKPLHHNSSVDDMLSALEEARGKEYTDAFKSAAESKLKSTPDELKIIEANLASLRRKHIITSQKQMKYLNEAKEARKALSKRLDEDALLRVIESKLLSQNKHLSLSTLNGQEILKVPGSEALFKAAESLGGLPIIKESRQAWANAFKARSALPDELGLVANRSLSNTPNIIKIRVDELEKSLGKFTSLERIASFKSWYKGVPVGNAHDEITQEMDKLLPYFTGKEPVGEGFLSVSDINKYLPANLQVGHRTIKTSQDIIKAIYQRKNRVGNIPDDPMDFLWTVRIAVEQALDNKARQYTINKTFGVNRGKDLSGKPLVDNETNALIEDLRKTHGWETIKELGDESHLFPPEIVPDIRKLLEMLEPRNIGKVGRLIDQATGLWKMGVTVYNPGYYTRNGMGEVMASWFDGVTNPMYYKKAMSIVKYAKHDGKELEELRSHTPWLSRRMPSNSQIGKRKVVTLKGGHKLSIEDVYVLYHDQGLKTGFFNTERSLDNPMSSFVGKLKDNKLSKGIFNSHESIRAAGEWYEDYFRFAHFLHALEHSGASHPTVAAEYAARKVRKYHFDYSDFTNFEKTTMLRAFPFYKWSRKALPLMSTMMFTKPGKFTAYSKVMNSLSTSPSEVGQDENGFAPNYEAIVPQWLKDMWGYKISEDANGDYTYFNAATPNMDVAKMTANPKGTALSMLNPLFKLPAEQVAGKTFGDMSIPFEDTNGTHNGERGLDDTGLNLANRGQHLIGATPQGSFINKILRNAGTGKTDDSALVEPGNKIDETALSFLTGLGFYENNQNRKGGSFTEGKPSEPSTPFFGLFGNNFRTEEYVKPTKPVSSSKLHETLTKLVSNSDKNQGDSPVGSDILSDFRLHGFEGLEAPIPDIDISSDFGSRTHPITGKHSNHTGVDFPAKEGTPIRAPANGVVGNAHVDSVYGNQVIMYHSRRKATMYGHMAKYIVRSGDKVKKGQIIGYVGSTGLSTGPHLHFETWIDNQPVDPMTIL